MVIRSTPGVGLRRLGRRREAVVELDALAERAQRARPTPARRDLGQVLLLHAVAGVGDAVRQVAVVGEQQQALGVDVESPHREHAGLGRAPARRRSGGRGCPSPW